MPPNDLRVNGCIGSGLNLSWPGYGTNYTLEATGRLASPTWVEVPAAPVLVEGRLTLTDEISGSSRYYRLRQR